MTNNDKIMALILAPKPTNYAIWKHTGVSQATLSKIKSGKIDLDNLTSKNFDALLDFYNMQKGGLMDE